MLHPQNGDRIVAIDSVTLLHPMYSRTLSGLTRVRSASCSLRRAVAEAIQPAVPPLEDDYRSSTITLTLCRRPAASTSPVPQVPSHVREVTTRDIGQRSSWFRRRRRRCHRRRASTASSRATTAVHDLLTTRVMSATALLRPQTTTTVQFPAVVRSSTRFYVVGR